VLQYPEKKQNIHAGSNSKSISNLGFISISKKALSYINNSFQLGVLFINWF